MEEKKKKTTRKKTTSKTTKKKNKKKKLISIYQFFIPILILTFVLCLCNFQVSNIVEPKQIVDFMKELNSKGINTKKIRVQVQLHKVIWDPKKRGV